MIKAICQKCSAEFLTYKREIRRGKGKFCSLSCAASTASKNRTSQNGDKNPNWRGGNGVTKEQVNRYRANYRANHPEKNLAHNLISRAIASGKITPRPCEICGDKAEAHHDDYEKPLEVRWLCRQHHREFHNSAG